MKKCLKSYCALICAASLAVCSATAFDLASAENRDDIQFKRELLYTLSKADDIQRQFRDGTLSELQFERILTDENLLFVLQNELRYEDVWNAVQVALAGTETLSADGVPAVEEVTDEQ